MTNYSRRSTDTMIRTDAMQVPRPAFWIGVANAVWMEAVGLGLPVAVGVFIYWLWKHGVIQ